MIPVAARILGDTHEYVLRMKSNYAVGLYKDEGATLADLREAVTTLEDMARIARRLLGGAHPTSSAIEECLGYARAALSDRETPPSPPPSGRA